MTDPIPVIMNPAARSTLAAGQQDALEALQPSPELHFTSGTGDAAIIAERLVREGHPLVVAAGGDGTVNEVLQGLCRANAERPEGTPQAALGVLPLGTMNVFSYELGLPGRDLVACWERVVSGRRQEVDLWQANDQFFVQLAGVGLDAEVIRETTWEDKKRLGPLSYVLSAMRVLTREAPTLSVQIEGRPPIPSSLVLVGNGKHYGGPFPLFTRASLTDGLLDVVVFHRVGIWEATELLRSVLVNGYRPNDDIEYFQLAAFEVQADLPAPVEIDGELGGMTPIRFYAAPQRLIVAC